MYILLPDAHHILQAATILRAGRLVCFPTETVYGLGADAHNDAAAASVYQAKGRASTNPLIVHTVDVHMAKRYGIFTDAAMQLADVFWPGPLTLVVRRTVDCPASPRVSAGGDTIALRVPAHPVAQALLQAFGQGVAAPSANRSGRISPTCALHVVEEFTGNPLAPEMILDGGEAEVGIESTVVDCTRPQAEILRAGTITEDALRAVLHAVEGMPSHHAKPADAGSTLRSPGQLESHYAPRAAVRLQARNLSADEALLAFGPTELTAPQMRNLSPSGDLDEAARHLYAYLRELDATGAATIAVMPVPGGGIGDAINDRLRRAAAQRPAPADRTL